MSKGDAIILDTASANCRELLDCMTAHGVRHAVISPGSRNTPLIIGLSARETIKKVVIADERTAAFAALGMSTVLQTPVALVCTSGTALYNYAPAVAEAFYRHIPLIVITADRPAQWIDQDDSQTLVQMGALEKIVKKSYDISPEAGTEFKCTNPEYLTEREWYVNRLANDALLTATTGTPGPVHINLQLGGALGETVPYREHIPRTVSYMRGPIGFSPMERKQVGEILGSKRVMLVAGFMQPNNKLNAAAARFASLPNVVVMAETISNLHLKGREYMIDTVLSKLSQKRLKQLAPDIVITIGGALVSRQLKEYLRSSNCEHWSLGDAPLSVDTLQHLNRHFELTAEEFLTAITAPVARAFRKLEESVQKGLTEFKQDWEEARCDAKEFLDEYVGRCEWSDMKAMSLIFPNITPNINLFLSNGTSVRYAQLFTERLPHAGWCNRGVSGIEGGSATALGGAYAYQGKTLLISGDMSFVYDTGILGIDELNKRLNIIILNNGGGGIFRFIPSTRSLAIRERYFCAPQNLPLEKLCAAYDWTYLRAADYESLSDAMAYSSEHSRVLIEVVTDGEISGDILYKYMNQKI